MSTIKISKRLCTASSLVRDGAVLADVGTDHAYLPIYLVQKGRIKRAVASDINVGPLKKAIENIEAYGVSGSVETFLTNGLSGIENFAPTDITICGMGGELIAEILDSCEYVKNPSVRLILQPMTCVKELREYLQNGFSTVVENVVCEDGKIYQIMCVEYDGLYHSLSDVELEIGPRNLENKGFEVRELIYSTIAKKQKILDGLKKGGHDTSVISNEIKELESLL
jgi:tRNA (adenine22-N1)-methyltransferase